jgi:hypothetical protein
VQPGLEWYDTFGEIGDMPALDRQQHVLFPAVDLQFGGWTWNIGVGFGLTGSSDAVTIKSILSYEFDLVTPPTWFR